MELLPPVKQGLDLNSQSMVSFSDNVTGVVGAQLNPQLFVAGQVQVGVVVGRLGQLGYLVDQLDGLHKVSAGEFPDKQLAVIGTGLPVPSLRRSTASCGSVSGAVSGGVLVVSNLLVVHGPAPFPTYYLKLYLTIIVPDWQALAPPRPPALPSARAATKSFSRLS